MHGPLEGLLMHLRITKSALYTARLRAPFLATHIGLRGATPCERPYCMHELMANTLDSNVRTGQKANEDEWSRPHTLST